MLAPCGLLCNQCEAYLATQNNDEKELKVIAEKWSNFFHAPIEAEHLLCDGCISGGRKAHYCQNLCEIKKCVDAKQLQHCGYCEAFACHLLEALFQNEPRARERLTERNQK
ncbi:MAG: DUF3795 domain-containing protein [Candidatus Marinimicrobia bacterium]|nr:DUF3795 domain-containing protein [Candidatus Neomarinimicrobiota bacterium]